MNYEERAKKAHDENSVKRINTEYIKLDKEGESIIGKLLGVSVIEAKKNLEPCNSYSFETDRGQIATLFGTAFDKTNGTKLVVGNVYEITFKGLKTLDKGRRVKLYDVFLIESSIGTPKDDAKSQDFTSVRQSTKSDKVK